MDADLRRWLNSALPSPVVLIGDWSWPDGRSMVAEVKDATGSVWFIKQHRDLDRFEGEKGAYRLWVPALGDRAPALGATSDRLRVLVLSAVPGAPGAGWEDEATRRDGGAVLQRLHAAEDCGRCDDLPAEKALELDQWASEASELLTTDELDFLRSAVAELAGVAAPDRVPCHRDYTPRNWVVADGRVHVVDFEEMRPEAWMVDLGRMAIGWWLHEPHLMEAVLDGYGRYPSADEVEIMRRCYLVTVVRHIVLGTRYRKTDFVASTRQLLPAIRRLL